MLTFTCTVKHDYSKHNFKRIHAYTKVSLISPDMENVLKPYGIQKFKFKTNLNYLILRLFYL